MTKLENLVAVHTHTHTHTHTSNSIKTKGNELFLLFGVYRNDRL